MGGWTAFLICLFFVGGWAISNEDKELLKNPNLAIHYLNKENLARLEEHQDKAGKLKTQIFGWDADYSSIFFKLYTPEGGFENPAEFRENVTAQDLLNGNFKPSRMTKIISHGFTANYRKMEIFAKAYLSNPELSDVNVIIVDWSSLAYWSNYISAAINSVAVGKHIGKFLGTVLIQDLEVDPKNVHAIGHSLGAHLSGHLGRNMEFTGAKGKIGRVTGLDPAKPWFDLTSKENRISRGDADMVDVIHTNSGQLWEGGLSFTENLGTVDFYPNGGRHQPGCTRVCPAYICLLTDLTDLVNRACSHLRVKEYYVESLSPENNGNYDFASNLCSNYTEFEGGKCTDQCSRWQGYKSCLHMGEWLEKSRVEEQPSNKAFYLYTNPAQPFSET